MTNITIYTINIPHIRQLNLDWMKYAMPQRWERVQRFVREQDKLLGLGAGYLLRNVADIESESELTLTKNGKPIAVSKADFSLAHSGERSTIVINNGKIGLDIEKIENEFPQEAQMIFTEEEKTFCRKAPNPNICAYQLWTMKESVLKAIGLGFSFDPASFCVLPAFSKEPVKIGENVWHIACGVFDGYSCSVCREKPINEINWIEI